jgi:prepilin-type N-terminal cleavage/methylation domain-containing protein
MKTNRMPLSSSKGFTLIEVIAVLVLLGILAAVAVPRYIDLSANARDRAIDAAVAELNGRETLTWANALLSTGGWTADALPSDTSLGSDYTWGTDDPTTSGGSITFQGTTVALSRTASTLNTPGRWSR